MDILPIFSSHFSIKSSILTLELPKDSYGDSGPKSIIEIAQENNIKEIYLLENNFSGFVQAYKNFKESEIQLRFGLQLVLCNNRLDKSEESVSSEHKVNIWMQGSESYKKLIKIYSKAATEGFFNKPRLDCQTLAQMWDEEFLTLTIPYYDSFLHRNLLHSGNCLPDFEFTQPALFIEHNDLPFNFLIDAAIEKFNQTNKWETINTQSIFYHKKSDFLYYLAYKCLFNRSTLDRPEVSHLGSDNFCFEHYRELLNK